jgi:hypothetical protein
LTHCWQFQEQGSQVVVATTKKEAIGQTPRQKTWYVLLILSSCWTNHGYQRVGRSLWMSEIGSVVLSNSTLLLKMLPVLPA